jgi:uncharacterized protein YjiK
VDLTLTFVRKISIRYDDLGLSEASGICYSGVDESLWVVSDDTPKLFKIDLFGKLLRSIDLPADDLEGLTLDPNGHVLALSEGRNAICVFNTVSGQVSAHRRLKDMRGYDKIAKHFENDDRSNQGLEGLCWHTLRHTIFAIKESKPKLLIEISPDLRKTE